MKKMANIFICTVIIVSTFTVTACEKKDKASIENKEKIKTVNLYNEKEGLLDLALYFNSSKDDNKVEISKEERLISKDEVIGELIMNELIKGPYVNGSLKPILSKNTKLLSFSIKDGIAYVNFNEEVKMPMKPELEETTLKAIATSLTQLQVISKVKIQIGNKDVDTLGGNYDISKPFGKDDIVGRRKK